MTRDNQLESLIATVEALQLRLGALEAIITDNPEVRERFEALLQESFKSLSDFWIVSDDCFQSSEPQLKRLHRGDQGFELVIASHCLFISDIMAQRYDHHHSTPMNRAWHEREIPTADLAQRIDRPALGQVSSGLRHNKPLQSRLVMDD